MKMAIFNYSTNKGIGNTSDKNNPVENTIKIKQLKDPQRFFQSNGFSLKT
jgi:hypothetical protein